MTAPFESVTFVLERQGKMVSMHLNIRHPTGSALGGGVYARIPVGYRPTKDTGYMPAVWAGTAYSTALVSIDTDGNLVGICTAMGNNLIMTATWLAA